MIDFRYHIVSLMAVLIALTIGVVLGAGPLQGPLSSTLNGQLESLKESQNTSRLEIENLRGQVQQRDQTIEGIEAQVLPGTLKDKKVAIVTFPSANPDAVESVKKDLKEANATIASEISLNPEFINVAKVAYRSELSKRIPANLGSNIPPNASAEELLFDSLVNVLTDNNEDTKSLKTLLTSADSALVKFPENFESANAIVVIGDPTNKQPDGKSADKPEDPAKQTSNDAVIGIARAMSTLKIPNVIVGAAQTTSDNISIIRSENMKVATVDSVGKASASLSVALVLGGDMQKVKQAYGFETGAAKALPLIPKAK